MSVIDRRCTLEFKASAFTSRTKAKALDSIFPKAKALDSIFPKAKALDSIITH